MPIKIPKQAKLFEGFCKNNPNSDRERAMFPTMAHLVISAAAIGCNENEMDEEVEFSSGDPIQMQIFKNQNLYDYILLISLKNTNKPKIIDNEDEMCRIIEKYASAGLRHMSNLYNEAGASAFLSAWESLVVD